MNKIQAAEQLRRALQMFAMTLDDEEAMEIATIYPAWESGRNYKSGDIRSYGVNDVGDPQLYRCVQGHMSQADWTPDATPALWVAIGLAPDGIAVWSKPTGAHDAYNTGNSVHYPGKSDPVYTSLIDGNVYSPEEYPAGWKLEA
jgi:hypothetical protein